jgi:hypothetical protein
MSDGLQNVPDFSLCPGAPLGTSQGAIYAIGADVKIYTSTFKNNTADYVSECVIVCRNVPDFSPCPGAPKGGAIYAVSAEVKIYTSTFESNTASTVSRCVTACTEIT